MPPSPSRSRGTRRQQWMIGGLTVLILAFAVVIGYRRQTTKEDESRSTARPPVLRPQPVTVVAGIHLLGGLAPAAAYVVETSEGLVLIDTGLDKQADLLKKQMAALKLDWRRICAIFLTHVHGDHCGGAEHLRAATGAKVYAGRDDAAVLRAGQPREAFFSTFAMPEQIIPSRTTVDVELDREQTVAVGDVRFRALITPGHTPGSVCYLMERGDQTVLFSGDVIWSLSTPDRPDSIYARPLGTYAAYLAPRYRGDAKAFLSTLRMLRALPAPQLVLPGHPRNDVVPASPVMNQKRWEMLLDAGIREMERVLGRHAKDGASFLDGVPKKLLTDLYYLGDFKDVAVYGFFASSKLFIVGAPGGTGSSGFLDERLRQLGLKPAAPTAVLLTSGSQEEIAGLAELVEKTGCQVVASPAAEQRIKTTCPTQTSIIAVEELPRQNWFSVEPILLSGRGLAPVAYHVRWAGKSVLFSGQIPIHVTRETSKALSQDFIRGQGKANDYRTSLVRLQDLKPDLWLPSFPADGQNANLYDREWEEILAENRNLLR